MQVSLSNYQPISEGAWHIQRAEIRKYLGVETVLVPIHLSSILFRLPAAFAKLLRSSESFQCR